MQIELLVLEGCPQGDEMRTRLTSAILRAGLPMFKETSLQRLDDKDERKHYMCPTVLVEGREIFGIPEPDSVPGPVCREYPDGLPTTEELIELLFMRYREIRQKLEDFR